MKQQYTYTYDNALGAFSVMEVDTDRTLLKCENEIVAIQFIADLLTGLIDAGKFEETLDMTASKEGVE